MLGHLNFFRAADFSSQEPRILREAQITERILFNGPAAVIVFFVISGFVIHLPQVDGSTLYIRVFYLRRYTRIVIPLAAAIGLWLFVGSPISAPSYGVFWSVGCELVYYTFYPILLSASQSLGSWLRLIVLALLPLAVLFVFNLHQVTIDPDYFSLNLWTPIVGLPVWLAGCWLAEVHTKFPSPSRPALWLYRSIILLCSISLRFARFHLHGPIFSNIFMLTGFAAMIFLWLGSEIRAFETRPPPAWFERQGKWSYSLYLIHLIGLSLFIKCGVPLAHLQQDIVPWARIITALFASYVFYQLVEAPSHRLARVFRTRHPLLRSGLTTENYGSSITPQPIYRQSLHRSRDANEIDLGIKPQLTELNFNSENQ